MNKLRLGVILAGANVPMWVARTLEQIKESSYAEVIAITCARDADGVQGRIYEKYLQLDQRVFYPGQGSAGWLDAHQIVEGTHLGGEAWTEGIAGLGTLRLDVILNLSLRVVPTSMLDVARLGVWSLRCNGGRVVMGTPFGWLELLNNEHLVHCVIEAQRGATVQSVAKSVMASHPESFTHNQRTFLWRASALIPRALKALHTKGESGFFSGGEVLGHATELSRPAAGQILALACKQALRVFEARVWRRFAPQRWVLMAGASSRVGLPDLSRLRPIAPPRGVFWADPFLLERQGRMYAIFEEYVYRDCRAHISVAEIHQDGGMGEATVALKRPYHLSYPFVFEYRGEWYMIPETAQNRSIEVYQCSHFPDQWEYRGALMRDVRAVDATLIKHAGVWWMFANIAAEGGSTWDELHLFYSDDPLSDQWSPHPKNPVVSDVRSARPAGRIVHENGMLLRPSQDSSVRYGYALNFNRITKLSKSEYEEELLERIEPPKSGDILAVHTFNAVNGLAIVDAMMK